MAVIGLFLLTVVADGHLPGPRCRRRPTIIPTAFLVVWLLLGRAVRPRLVAVSGAVTLAALALFAAIDLSRPESDRRILGRWSARWRSGGGRWLGTVLAGRSTRTSPSSPTRSGPSRSRSPLRSWWSR
ncbi:MAG: hypothetical protein R2746_09415 [Acidimicrobiales bacterium]